MSLRAIACVAVLACSACGSSHDERSAPIAESLLPRAAAEPSRCTKAATPETSCLGACVPAARTKVPHPNPLVARLRDGRALVIGGDLLPHATELWEPWCDRFRLVAQTSAPRARRAGRRPSGTTLVLGDERVIVIGGDAAPMSRCTWEAFNPAFETWSRAVPVPTGHCPVAATQLHDGRVLAIQGTTCSAHAMDPTTGDFSELPSWSSGARVCDARRVFTLADGRVALVARLSDGENPALDRMAAALYDTNGEWPSWRTIDLPAMQPAHDADGDVALLNDGRIAVLGREFSVIFDPVSGSFRNFPLHARPSATVTPLGCGNLFVAGDASPTTPAAELRLVIDPDSGKATIAPLALARIDHAAVALEDGRVLLVGGRVRDGRSLLAAEVCR